MKNFQKVFKWIIISFMLAISFEIATPQHANAETDYEKIVRIKEWFRNSGYTYSLKQHNPDKLLQTGRGNCVAFTLLFQRMTDNVRLQSKTMGSPHHAYNIVRIDGQEYFFDWCNFTCNYTKNYRRLVAMYPGRKKEIKKKLNKDFREKFLGFDYPTADANLGSTSIRFYTPASLCQFEPDGTLWSNNVGPVQDAELRGSCTQMFDWSRVEDDDANIVDPNIVTNVELYETQISPEWQKKQQTTQTNARPNPYPHIPFTLPTQTVEPDEEEEEVRICFLRAYNGIVHHYTTNWGEMNCLVQQYNWTYEQAAFQCFKTPKEGRFAIFRLYNPNDKNGNHLLTISEPEKDWLVQQGWAFEGIEGYVPITQTMYRLYNENTSEHFYTENIFEVQAAVAAGWKHDGTVW